VFCKASRNAIFTACYLPLFKRFEPLQKIPIPIVGSNPGKEEPYVLIASFPEQKKCLFFEVFLQSMDLSHLRSISYGIFVNERKKWKK